MSNIFRILSFVPPALLFFLPAFSQVQGTIEQIPGSNTYQVSIIPSVNWSPPQSVTSSAQITLRATAGKLSISGFQSQTGTWSADPPVSSPVEAPDFDYFSFSLAAPIASLMLSDGTPVPLFSFQNTFGCSHIEIVDNLNDPFMPPNSLSVNIGNSFSMVGAGIGQNAYTGNAANAIVECEPLQGYVTAADNPVKCNGERTAIVIQAIGGAEPYDILWENASTGSIGADQIFDFEGSTVIDNMPAGLYTFTFQDALDSIFQIDLNITEPAPLVLNLAAFDASCNGSLDGVAYVDNVFGGTVVSDYSYFWETDPTTSSPSIGFLDPGTYSVTVTDDNGCEASGSVDVNSFAVIYPNPYIRDITCYGAADGVIDLYPVGPNPPFTFEWSSNVMTGEFSSAWQLSPGYYSVTLTDATGVCFETAEFYIEEPPAIEADYRLTEPVCFDDPGHLEMLAVSNATEPWVATVAGGEDLGDGKNFEITPGFPGRLIVIDAKGCEISEDFLIPRKQEMLLELGDNLDIKYGETVHFDPDIFPLNNVELEWSPSLWLSCDDCPRPSAQPLETTTYRLRMVDTAGCAVEDNITIGVRISRDIYIPNAFSPNQDGINDTFFPNAGFEVVAIQSLQVFDRWGGLLFNQEGRMSPNEPEIGWDGTTQGKPADTGIYLYSMTVEFIDGEVVLYSGEINLLR